MSFFGLIDFEFSLPRDDTGLIEPTALRQGGNATQEPNEKTRKAESTESTEEMPAIATRSQAYDQLEAGTPRLEALAGESYEINSQAGESYQYNLFLDRMQNAMWGYGWCATSSDLLEQNWDHIRLVFKLNGRRVLEDRFVELEGTVEGLECRCFYTAVSDWPQGEHDLTTEVTFTSIIDDGLTSYPPEIHVDIYRVVVGR